MQTFLWWNLEHAERDLDLVKDMGFGWVKQGFAWRDIEGYEDAPYDWYRADYVVALAEQRGLKIIARLDRQPFWSQADGGATPLPNGPPDNLANFAKLLPRHCRALPGPHRRLPGVERAEPVARVEQSTAQRRRVRAFAEGCATRPSSRPTRQAIVISAPLAPTGNTLPEAIPDDEYFQQMYDAGRGPTSTCWA